MVPCLASWTIGMATAKSEAQMARGIGRGVDCKTLRQSVYPSRNGVKMYEGFSAT